MPATTTTSIRHTLPATSNGCKNILDTTPGVIATLEKQGNEFRKIFPDNTIVSVEYGSQKAENGDYEKLFAPLNKRIEAEADALRKTPERDHAELKTTIRINGKTFDIKIGLKKTWALSNEKDVRDIPRHILCMRGST